MRIFVTVGAQMPFDRLIAAMDAWAAAHPAHEVLAQIGDGAAPRHLNATRMLSPAELGRAFDDADLVVGHAGTGTLFAALERGTPIVVLPRRAARMETRNDHQVATAARFAARGGVSVAWEEDELPARIAEVDLRGAGPRLPAQAGGPLVRAIADFIGGATGAAMPRDTPRDMPRDRRPDTDEGARASADTTRHASDPTAHRAGADASDTARGGAAGGPDPAPPSPAMRIVRRALTGFLPRAANLALHTTDPSPRAGGGDTPDARNAVVRALARFAGSLARRVDLTRPPASLATP